MPTIKKLKKIIAQNKNIKPFNFTTYQVKECLDTEYDEMSDEEWNQIVEALREDKGYYNQKGEK